MATLKNDLASAKVTMADFDRAFDDVKPAFGVDTELLSTLFARGIIPYSATIQDILDEGKKYSNIVSSCVVGTSIRMTDITKVNKDGAASTMSLLLYGPQSSGTTALAARIANDSDSPLVKLVSADMLVGVPDVVKVAAIEKVFTDAFKSKSSIVILDSLERLFNWVPIGPRFSMAMVDALLIFMNKQPPPGHRLLILATTAIPDVLKELSFSFSREIEVPAVATANEVRIVLQADAELSPDEATRAMRTYGQNEVGIGIKKILFAIDRAREDEDMPHTFARLLRELFRREHGSASRPARDLRIEDGMDSRNLRLEGGKDPNEIRDLY
jgi:vesicle-fusing ATPase